MWLSLHCVQCSTTGVTKVVVCVILSGMMHIKELAVNRKEYPIDVAAVGFLSPYLSGSLPYV